MRINVVLNDEVINKALEISGLHTKKEVIDIALKEFIRNRSRLDVHELKGKIRLSKGYDYKKLRRDDKATRT